ncbi:phospholipid phosphatase [Paenibacillus glucanolyticus]|uniref:Phospholipid phosphatase n=1 Tax=Paenibacillus glucanolyticus TaxID=59843 RepID=A0A163EIM0_9BACL|nr:phosphatase PAP2 family protein [Paenibacillus glucanolyticus]KZS43825.1 phospholipid phosphatase [Paenibacillus glucanolyticus]
MSGQMNWASGRQRWIFFISLISFVGFIIMAALVKFQLLAPLDLAIITSIQNLEHPFITDIAIGLSFIGSIGPVTVLCLIVIAVLYWVLRRRTEILLLIVVVFGSSILNLLLKLIFQRVRPDIHRLVEITGYSFPSGHSMGAFSFYSVLAYLLWRHIDSRTGRGVLIAFAIIMILSIGLSRIYLGVHYPSDILGGYLASCAWVSFMVRYYERRMGKRGFPDA